MKRLFSPSLEPSLIDDIHLSDWAFFMSFYILIFRLHSFFNKHENKFITVERYVWRLFLIKMKIGGRQINTIHDIISIERSEDR